MEHRPSSRHRKRKAPRLRRRRLPCRHLDPTELSGEEDDEIEIGGGGSDDEPLPAIRGAP